MIEIGGLRRALGIWPVVAFGVTNEIAAGLFFVSTQIQATVPGVGDMVPWLMIVGGALTYMTVIAYRYFFAAGLVGAGGEYVIISRAINPFFGFLATFLAWFGLTGSLGTLSYTAPKFLANACAAVGSLGAAQVLSSPIGTLVTGLVLLWGVWLIHVRGVHIAGTLVVIAMVFVIVVACVVIGYGFSTDPRTFALAMQAHLHVSAQRVAAASPASRVDLAAAFGRALPILFFGYLGLSTATQTGGEAINAQRSLSKAVVIAVTLVTVIYTLFAFGVYHAVPWQLIAGLSALKFTTYTTSTGLLGMVMPNWLASLMNVFVAVIVIKTFLPVMLAQSRWIYAWAQDGLIPARFAVTHVRFQTPVLALTVAAILGSLTLLESLPRGYVFGVNLRVLASMVVFFLIGLGMWRYPGPVRIWRFAVGAGIMAFSLWFAISIVMSAPGQALWFQPAFQMAVVTVIGVLIYLYAPKRRSRRRAAAMAD